MTIIQPRLNNEPCIDEMPVDELLDWAENYVKPRAELAYAGVGDFCPGKETCKWCRAQGQCKARYRKNLELYDDTPDLMLISIEEAAAVLEKADDIKAWLSDLETLCMTYLFAGETVPGFKLVEGRSNRKYTDADQVVEAMLAAGYEEATLFERKLITLTQMEKDFGKKAVGEILQDLIVKPQGKPTLAPEKDKRPAFIPDELILDAFDEE